MGPISAELPENARKLWKWLGDEGVVSEKSSVEPAVVPEGLGLVARRDIGRNEVVLEIPKRLWINTETVEASKMGALCGGLKPWVSVALFLIRKKYDEDSSWRAFLDMFPESTDSTIFWSEEELAELKGTQLLSTTLGVKEYVENEFLKLEQEILLPNEDLFPSRITLDDFIWAFGILRSRAFFRLPAQNLVFVPLAHLLDIAETNGMGETGYFDIVDGQSLPAGMLQYIRLVGLSGSDAFLLESIFRNTIWGHLELPVSRSNEELICRVVRDACKFALSGFTTTIEEDEKLLEEGNLNPRMEMALKIRIGEKRVLQQIDQIFKDRELELDVLEYYQERRLKDLGLVGEQGEIIFWE